MFDVAHAEMDEISVVEKHVSVPYSVKYDTLNCSKLEFCATLRCFVAQLFVENLPQNVWSLVDSVGITMNFLICLAFVNLF